MVLGIGRTPQKYAPERATEMTIATATISILLLSLDLGYWFKISLPRPSALSVVRVLSRVEPTLRLLDTSSPLPGLGIKGWKRVKILQPLD